MGVLGRLPQFQIGQRLWDHTAGAALGVLRRLLSLLGLPEAKFFTWKCVRAGRATDMAAQGCTLGSILGAGEWRSVAMFRYINEQEADAAEVLRQTLDASEDDNDVS